MSNQNVFIVSLYPIEKLGICCEFQNLKKLPNQVGQKIDI
jgi:hypothetical protein